MSYFEFRQFDCSAAHAIDRLEVGTATKADIDTVLGEQRCLAICRAALIAHHACRLWLVDFVDTTVDPPERLEVARVGKQYAPEDRP